MIKFRLAIPSDESQIRRLLWATPMRGIVDLVFAREPNYLALGNTQGQLVQTLVASQDEKILGLATRAIRTTKINGIATDSGYLADFRLHPEIRGRYALAKGYKFFLQLHKDNRTKIYTALVVENNKNAMSTLLSGRANLPICNDLGRILTPLILVNKNRVLPVKYQKGSIAMLPEIVATLNCNDRQFAPVYSVEDFTTQRFPNFNINDFVIIRKHDRIAGVAGLWVQTDVRQTIALRYTGFKKIIRPIANRVLGLGLPAPGKPFRSAYMSFVQCEDAESYEHLINACLNIAKERKITHLVTGVHELDDRSHVLKKFSAIRFTGRLFSVTVERDFDLDNRVPYIEPATL